MMFFPAFIDVKKESRASPSPYMVIELMREAGRIYIKTNMMNIMPNIVGISSKIRLVMYFGIAYFL